MGITGSFDIGGAGSGPATTSSGPTLWVDSQNGDDSLAMEGIQYGVAPNPTPFLTIGAANAAAAAITQLAAPAFPGTVFTNPQTTGGFLGQSTEYFYVITALSATGETIASAEQTYTTPASGTSTNTITINWTPVTGATGYNIYRSGSTGTEKLAANIVGGSSSSFTDTVNANGGPIPPTTNTTASALIQCTAGYFLVGTFTTGLRLTPGVWLNGMGDSTILLAWTGSHGVINPGTNCTISHLQILGNQSSGVSQQLVGGTQIGGTGNSDQAGDNVNFWNVHIKGGADCLYLSKNSSGLYPSMTWKFFSCLFESLFDTTNVLDTQSGTSWPLTLNFYGCRFISTADTLGNLTRCLAITSGTGITMNVYGGSATCTGGSGGTAVVSCAGSGNTINLYGVAIVTSSSGGTQNSIKVSNGNTVHIGAGCDFDPSLISNSGTITTQAQILGNFGTTATAGTASSAATLTAGSTDIKGQVTLTPVSLATGALVTISFAAAKRTSFPTLTPVGTAGGADVGGATGVNVGSIIGTQNGSATGFTINTGATGLSTTPIIFNYHDP